MKRSGIGVGIVGIGAALPSTVRENSWWSEEFVSEHLKTSDKDVIASIGRAAMRGDSNIDPEVARYSKAVESDPFRGARRRRVIDDGQSSSHLEAEACRAALSDAGLEPSGVDLLVTFSQVPDFPCPGNHALVAEMLGLRHSVASMTIGADCASFVPGFAVASRLVESGEYGVALVVQSNASSRVSNWRRPASIVVGDGAVACVVTKVDAGYGYIGSKQTTRGNFHAAVRIAPHERNHVPWYRGDEHQSALVFQSMDPQGTVASGGRSISFCREVCDELLDQTGYSANDVDFFVASQPTSWFVHACCDSLGIPHDKTMTTFSEYGHLMPASAPINLWSAYRDGRLKHGDLVLLYTPGAGFIQASCLFRWFDSRRR